VPALILGVGYIGAALADRLCAGGESVIGLDNGFSTDWRALSRLAKRHSEKLRLLAGDVRDRATLDSVMRVASPISAVYLLAAQASAHPHAASPEYTEEANLRAPRLILDAARAHGAPPVVYGSSFHLYGQPLQGVVTETQPYGAFSDLSHLSKVYAEKLGEMYAMLDGVPFAPVRLGIVYGIGPVTKTELRFVTVPHAFCLRALRGETLRVTQSGVAPLGFIHIEDAVSALIAAVPKRDYAPANAVGEVASAAAVAHAVMEAARLRRVKVEIEIPDQSAMPADPPYSVTSRLTAAGWQPRRLLADGVDEILAYYAENLTDAQHAGGAV
jgi:nucleoside-diphosphate-sugar epimerase